MTEGKVRLSSPLGKLSPHCRQRMNGSSAPRGFPIRPFGYVSSWLSSSQNLDMLHQRRIKIAQAQKVGKSRKQSREAEERPSRGCIILFSLRSRATSHDEACIFQLLHSTAAQQRFHRATPVRLTHSPRRQCGLAEIRAVRTNACNCFAPHEKASRLLDSMRAARWSGPQPNIAWSVLCSFVDRTENESLKNL